MDTMDGSTFAANDGTYWFNLRPSNTEPFLRLNVEARTARDGTRARPRPGQCPALNRTWQMNPQTARPRLRSWRDSVPEACATDLENLLGTGIGAAQEQLERNGGFLPFALVVENDGEVRLVAVTPADAEEGSDGGFDADAMISDLTEVSARTVPNSGPPPSSATSSWSRRSRMPSTSRRNTGTGRCSPRSSPTPPTRQRHVGIRPARR